VEKIHLLIQSKVSVGILDLIHIYSVLAYYMYSSQASISWVNYFDVTFILSENECNLFLVK